MLQKPHSGSNPRWHSQPGDVRADARSLFEQLSLAMSLAVSGTNWRGCLGDRSPVCVPCWLPGLGPCCGFAPAGNSPRCLLERERLGMVPPPALPVPLLLLPFILFFVIKTLLFRAVLGLR